MLKKIDQADIEKLDDEQRQHLMVNAEGEYVFAQADEKAWKRHLEQVEASKKAAQNVQSGDKELQERGLECPIDKRLFVDPMKTPCCGKTYCHDCIENALLDNDLTCPGCQTENVSLEGLVPDEDMKQKIKEFQDQKSNDKQRSRSPTAEAASRGGSKSPVSVAGKKRTASDANDSSLLAPIMKRQKSNEGSAVATPQPESAQPGTPSASGDSALESALTGPASTNTNFDDIVMPPDVSQMQNMMNQMGMMNPMLMNNPMMMQQMMMGMGYNPMAMGMLGNNGMNGMNGMNNMNGNQNFGGNAFDQSQNFNNHNQGGWQPRGGGRGGRGRGRGSWQGNQNNQNFNQQGQNQSQGQQQQPKQPEGLANVPKGPKAMQTAPSVQSQGQAQGFNPPTGPSAKFSNQQRYVGNEEDNAYMRQPVNPQRQWNKRGGKKMREAEYRELGQGQGQQ